MFIHSPAEQTLAENQTMVTCTFRGWTWEVTKCKWTGVSPQSWERLVFETMISDQMKIGSQTCSFQDLNLAGMAVTRLRLGLIQELKHKRFPNWNDSWYARCYIVRKYRFKLPQSINPVCLWKSLKRWFTEYSLSFNTPLRRTGPAHILACNVALITSDMQHELSRNILTMLSCFNDLSFLWPLILMLQWCMTGMR